MVPKINSQGQSFKGVTAYLMHDKQADTAERVAWFETGNMLTNDPEKAAKVMAWTDQNADALKRDFGGSAAGRKTETGAVYHYSLSWAKGEAPDQQHQKEQALATLERLGLEDHQFYMVAHDDTAHAHVHVVANLTHPETGKRAHLGLDKRELQAWALDYEREHGLHCEMREENAAKREAGEATKHQDKKQDYSEAVTRAYHASDNGQSFVNALRDEGLELAPARRGKGFVVVDSRGDIQKLGRQLEIDLKGSAKTNAINELLKDVDRSALPDPDKLAAERKAAFEANDKAAEVTPEFAEATEQKAPKYEAQKAAEEERAAYEKQQRFLAFENRRQERIEERREYWQIPKLEQEQREAQQHLDDHSGWFYRYILRSKHADAKHDAWAADKNLEHARDRWQQDIRALYAKAPDWVLNEQLEARGLSDSAVNTGEGQERTEMEAAQAKDEQENQALIEAQGSDEAAARLDGVVTAKSNVQKQKLAQVHSRAEAFKSKQAAAKQEVERTDREKDKEREHKEVEKRALRAKVLDERERDEDQKAHDREELEHTALDALDSQLAQDMADQRAELEADDYSLSEYFKEPEFDSDEERQLWHDMRRQRLEIDRDEDGIEHE